MGRRDVLKVTRAVWMGTTGKICTHLAHTAALKKGHGMESGKLSRKVFEVSVLHIKVSQTVEYIFTLQHEMLSRFQGHEDKL